MNYNDLINLIKNEHKAPYSEEELFYFAKLHKYDLNLKEKNWNKLANFLGLKSGESYRCWFKYKEKSNKFSQECCNKFDKEKTSSIPTDTKYIELYKQQTKTRDYLNAYRRTLRDEARIESLKDSIEACISKLKRLPKVRSNHELDMKKLSGNEAVLLLSDLHVGVECNNFYNKYNIDIAARRLSKLQDEVVHYCNLNDIDILNILNLGDMIHGIIHITSRIESQVDVIEQVMVAAELLSDFLNGLSNRLNSTELVYRSCTDNHSRVIADKSQHIEKENLSKLIDWYIKARLKNTTIVFDDNNIDDSLGLFTLISGKKCIFTHGHLDSIDKSLQNFIGATHEFINYAFFGHYHCEKMKSFQDYRVFINGSIVGVEQYALSKRLFSRPSQKLIIFNNKDNNIIDISIDLDVQ